MSKPAVSMALLRQSLRANAASIAEMVQIHFFPSKLIFAKLFRCPEFFAGYSSSKAVWDLLSPRSLPGPARHPGIRADEGLGRHLSPAAHLPGLGIQPPYFSPGGRSRPSPELQLLVTITSHPLSSALQGHMPPAPAASAERV